MPIVNIHEAKTHFSQIVNQVLGGKEVIIARGGKPLIKLIPYEKEPVQRKGGQFKGLIQIREDFDAPLPEDVLKNFYGDQEQ